MVVVATDILHWSAGFSRLVNAASGGISCVGSEMELFFVGYWGAIGDRKKTNTKISFLTKSYGW